MELDRAARNAGDRAKSATGTMAGSLPVRGLSRFGLACRGAVYVLVGYLAGRIALAAAGEPEAAPGQPADAQGAVQQVAGSPPGRLLLVLLALGLVGYAVSQLVEVVFRPGRAESRARRWSQRLISAWGVVLYGAFAASTVSFLLGSRRATSPGSSSRQDTALTARILREPLGRPLVVLVGVLLVGAGLEMGRRAVRLNFRERFNPAQVGPWVGRVARILGSVGCWSRAAVFALVGGFVVHAGVTFDPSDAKGLDASLRSLARTAYGPALLGVVAVGLVAYGIYCVLEARYRQLPEQ